MKFPRIRRLAGTVFAPIENQLEPLLIQIVSRGSKTVALDLPDNEQALAIAKRIAERTGRAVTARTDEGVLATFLETTKH